MTHYDFSDIWGPRITTPCVICNANTSGYPVCVGQDMYWLCKSCDVRWEKQSGKDFLEYMKEKKLD